MDLIGAAVTHNSFGAGTIIEQDDNYITVEFQAKTIRFLYLGKDSPFTKFMKADDPDIHASILKANVSRIAKEKEALTRPMEEYREKVYLEGQEKRAKQREKQKEKREYNRKYSLSPNNLALLGALDDFYNLYDALVQLFTEETEQQSGKFPKDDEFRRQIRKLCEPVLNKFSYVFTEDYPELRAPEYAFRHFRMVYLDIKGVDLCYRFISFRQFLGMIHRSITEIILHRNSFKEGNKKTNFSTVWQEINVRVGTLAQEKAQTRKVQNDAVIISEKPLFLFDSLTNTKCYRDRHTVVPKSYFATLIDESGSIDLPTHYCEECDKHFIGTRTLSLYEKNYGKMYIEKRSASEDDDFNGFALESRLHQLGYNVIDGELTEQQRHRILLHILETKKLSYFQICSSLEQNINFFKEKPSHRLAVRKWESDLRFLGDYIVGECMTQ